MQHVRQTQHEIIELGLRLGEFFLQAGEPVPQRLALGKQGCNVVPLRLCLADSLRVCIARGAHFVGGNLRCLAALLDCPQSLQVEFETPACEVLRNGGGVRSEQAWIEHGVLVTAKCGAEL